MTKIGINGFGRIGRFVFRASTKRDDIEVVAINDLLPVDYMAYMLKYDTMHGQFDGTVDYDLEKSLLIVNGKEIRVTACKNPAEIAWGAVEAEYVVESTGLFLTKEKAQAHIEAGAKYVGSLEGRHPHVRLRRKPQHLRKGYTVRFERILHHQLPCSYHQGAQRQVRRC